MRLLVCGGAGFIGSNFVRSAWRAQRRRDRRARQADLRRPAGESAGRRRRSALLASSTAQSRTAAAVAAAIEGAEAVVNFAAETHVDRSIAAPDAFVRTHALGTYVLLEAARDRGIRYVQVSTDEVYGSIEQGSFTESSPLEPSSPYSATKAGADLLVASYQRTYGLEAVICRGSNNYGPYQYPEKLIPLMVLNALHGDPPARLRRRRQRAQLALRRGLRGRNRLCARARRRRARPTTSAVPTSATTSTVVRRIIELSGADRR